METGGAVQLYIILACYSNNPNYCYQCPEGQFYSFYSCRCEVFILFILKCLTDCKNCNKPHVWHDLPRCRC